MIRHVTDKSSVVSVDEDSDCDYHCHSKKCSLRSFRQDEKGIIRLSSSRTFSSKLITLFAVLQSPVTAEGAYLSYIPWAKLVSGLCQLINIITKLDKIQKDGTQIKDDYMRVVGSSSISENIKNLFGSAVLNRSITADTARNYTDLMKTLFDKFEKFIVLTHGNDRIILKKDNDYSLSGGLNLGACPDIEKYISECPCVKQLSYINWYEIVTTVCGMIDVAQDSHITNTTIGSLVLSSTGHSLLKRNSSADAYGIKSSLGKSLVSMADMLGRRSDIQYLSSSFSPDMYCRGISNYYDDDDCPCYIDTDAPANTSNATIITNSLPGFLSSCTSYSSAIIITVVMLLCLVIPVCVLYFLHYRRSKNSYESAVAKLTRTAGFISESSNLRDGSVPDDERSVVRVDDSNEFDHLNPDQLDSVEVPLAEPSTEL